MLQVKCLAVDVDGTLTDEAGEIPVPVVEVLRQLRTKGFHVILVSGNSYLSLYALSRYLPVTKLVVAENGGVIGYREGYTILGRKEDGLEIQKLVAERLTNILVESWHNRFRFVDMAFHPAPGVNVSDAVAKATNELRPLGLEVVYSGWAIHIHKLGVNKGTGLLEVCKRLELEPSEIVAIGDSSVDKPMFEIAGLGIALANSPIELKEAATLVTKEGYWKGFLEALHILERKGFL
ncbi:MAG: phosphoglycolate phosphatase [Thermofilaceae archaeon]